MIALDTNVVIRYLTQDDPKQSAAASRLMEKTLSAQQPGYISLIVLVEIVWVLVSCYSTSRSQIAVVLENLLTTEQLHIEATELVWRAMRSFAASKADFSDALIAECSRAAGCQKTVTFDRAAASLAGMELLG